MYIVKFCFPSADVAAWVGPCADVTADVAAWVDPPGADVAAWVGPFANVALG